MVKSQNSFIKKQKAEKKRKKKQEKMQKRLDKESGSGALEDMIAYVDEFGNITSEPPEEPKEEKKSNN